MVDKEMKREGPFSMWRTTKGYYTIYEDDPKYGDKAVKKGMVLETAEREWNQLVHGVDSSMEEVPLGNRRNFTEDFSRRASSMPSRETNSHSGPSASEISDSEMSWFNLN